MRNDDNLRWDLPHPHFPHGISRRHLLILGLATNLHSAHAAGPQAPALLRQGGAVVLLRHALAPGTFDPPGFDLNDCSTQRLLSDEGRTQARRIGAWFSAKHLRPRQVRSSPWCRCMDTATLAFGQAESWPSLGSPYGRSEADKALAQQSLRTALAAVPPGEFDVWVTHSFVINALMGESVTQGQGLIVRHAPAGPPVVLESLSL